MGIIDSKKNITRLDINMCYMFMDKPKTSLSLFDHLGQVEIWAWRLSGDSVSKSEVLLLCKGNLLLEF